NEYNENKITIKNTMQDQTKTPKNQIKKMTILIIIIFFFTNHDEFSILRYFCGFKKINISKTIMTIAKTLLKASSDNSIAYCAPIIEPITAGIARIKFNFQLMSPFL